MACPSSNRRGFLRSMGSLSLSLAAAHHFELPAAALEQLALPQVPFGKAALSRLICGSNCFNAGSHLSNLVDKEMRAYFTPEQILKTLRSCQEAGISAWQISSLNNLALYRRFLDEGGKMQIVTLSRDPGELSSYAKGGCLGVAHHGEVTDNLFKAGKLDDVREFLKKVRDAGMLAGVSTHMPDVVDAIESKGWEVDYYMTCVYQRNRSEEELKKLLGYVPIPVREVYLKEDPPRMFKAIRATARPCLAFKILAAGRVCDNKGSVEQAFREAFQGIKPTDGVIVGIYDRYSNQSREDADLVRRFGDEKTS